METKNEFFVWLNGTEMAASCPTLDDAIEIAAGFIGDGYDNVVITDYDNVVY